jgi:5S rRNA maturation endonuclease (ribonuclease M5)
MKQRPSIADKRKASEKLQGQRTLCYRHSDISEAMNVFSLEADRANRLKEALQSAYEANRNIPMIVEGRRDVNALRKLGFTGEIIALHSGKSIYEFCEDLTRKYERVILLMDWDEKGEKLFNTLADNLRGYWEEFSAFRENIRALSQKDIKDIEGIPGLLERLSGTEITVGEICP